MSACTLRILSLALLWIQSANPLPADRDTINVRIEPSPKHTSDGSSEVLFLNDSGEEDAGIEIKWTVENYQEGIVKNATFDTSGSGCQNFCFNYLLLEAVCGQESSTCTAEFPPVEVAEDSVTCNVSLLCKTTANEANVGSSFKQFLNISSSADEDDAGDASNENPTSGETEKTTTETASTTTFHVTTMASISSNVSEGNPGGPAGGGSNKLGGNRILSGRDAAPEAVDKSDTEGIIRKSKEKRAELGGGDGAGMDVVVDVRVDGKEDCVFVCTPVVQGACGADEGGRCEYQFACEDGQTCLCHIKAKCGKGYLNNS